MHFTADRDALLKALTHVQGAVERKMTIPILAYVKIEATKRGLSLTGTDLDLEASAIAPAEVKAPGALTASAEMLFGFVKKLPAKAAIACRLDDNTLQLESGRAKLRLPVLPAGDFPSFAADPAQAHFTLAAPVLKRLIEETRFAISNEQTRYYLNGLFLHLVKKANDNRLAFVATDGHRLAYADTTAPEIDGEMPDVIVPRGALAALKAMLGDVEADVTVRVGKSTIGFAVGDFSLNSKLIDGSFPEYQRVVPANPGNTLTLSRAALGEALSRVLVVAGGDARAVRFEASAEGLTLRARNQDAGEASDELEAALDGGTVEMGFNGRYLADALAQSDAEEIVFRFTDNGSPAIVRAPGASSTFSVLMPLRV